MGQLVNGVWHDTGYDTSASGGAFVQSVSKFRSWITPDGAAGPTGTGGVACETGCYHLYVSHACPWAHRTMILRTIKGLQDHINVSVVHPDMLADGWSFGTDFAHAAIGPLFDTLNWLETRLGQNRYLLGDQITEADWRLFSTLVRFDPVYQGHFKCNRARIVDYPNPWGYTRALYQWPGVAATVHLDHITRHYHFSHDCINPHRIVPVGPVPDYLEPHGRG